jgi:hypothetical protein
MDYIIGHLILAIIGEINNIDKQPNKQIAHTLMRRIDDIIYWYDVIDNTIDPYDMAYDPYHDAREYIQNTRESNMTAIMQVQHMTEQNKAAAKAMKETTISNDNQVPMTQPDIRESVFERLYRARKQYL